MLTRFAKSFVVALAFAASVAPSVASVFLSEEESQRRDYQSALEALRNGNTARYRTLAKSLDGYVLHPYLEYELLKDRLSTTPPDAIRAFLEEAGPAPVGDMLRRKWLRQLVGRGDWDTFLKEYRDIEDDPELQCTRLNRLLKTSEQQAVLMDEIAALWRTGQRLPGICDPVFSAWRGAGHMTNDIVWERIRLAMERRNASLASELAVYLVPAERVWVNRWIAMHRDPASELANIRYPVETPTARMIVRHGVVRLAFRNSEEAMKRWESLKQKYQFFGEDDNYVLRHVGILAAQEHRPEALKWLSAVSAESNDENLHLWRVRAALRAGEWETARRFVAGLPEEQQKQAQWRYWKARVLEKTGDKAGAMSLYQGLAGERGYYGFLAADRTGTAYSMQHNPVEATPEEVSAMLARPGIQMAQELYLTGQTVDARRQWSFTTRRMNNRDLAVAAVIARQWGWHDRAILTVSKSDYQDDIELRFPLLYRDVIEEKATRNGLDAGWVYGVVRQESAFVPDARSGAGALGLMQLMPATGRLTGRRLNISVASTHALLDIEKNISLGAGYLREMLDRYRGNQVLATASYNAGPNRITDWFQEGQAMDAEIWVETIPFNETRDYVKNVLAFTTVYDFRLNNRPMRLTNRMPAVAPAK
jgi:soluble lytic murein transglycosylase